MEYNSIHACQAMTQSKSLLGVKAMALADGSSALRRGAVSVGWGLRGASGGSDGTLIARSGEPGGAGVGGGSWAWDVAASVVASAMGGAGSCASLFKEAPFKLELDDDDDAPSELVGLFSASTSAQGGALRSTIPLSFAPNQKNGFSGRVHFSLKKTWKTVVVVPLLQGCTATGSGSELGASDHRALTTDAAHRSRGDTHPRRCGYSHSRRSQGGLPRQGQGHTPRRQSFCHRLRRLSKSHRGLRTSALQ